MTWKLIKDEMSLSTESEKGSSIPIWLKYPKKVLKLNCYPSEKENPAVAKVNKKVQTTCKEQLSYISEVMVVK